MIDRDATGHFTGSLDAGHGALDGGPQIDTGDLHDAAAVLGDASADAAAPLDLSIQPSAACASGAAPATTGRSTLMVSGLQRQYLLHVPESAGTQPVPLVLALHGYTMNAAEHERITRMSTVADKEGFAVVYPEGIGDTSGWNAGSCCAYEVPPRDDLAFMDKLIDRVGEQLCIDLKRVYATGFSNGGMMVYRLACERSERIAAAASVSGSIVIPLEGCHPGRPMPFMHTHGTDDPVIPYAGGSGPVWLTPLGETPPDFPSVQKEVNTFAALNACSGAPRMTFQNKDASCQTYAGCDADASITKCVIAGGGHTWPGGDDMGLAGFILGYQSPSLPATQMIWDFLKPHRLP